MVDFLKDESLVIQLWARQEIPIGQEIKVQNISTNNIKSIKKDNNKSPSKISDKDVKNDKKNEVSIHNINFNY